MRISDWSSDVCSSDLRSLVPCPCCLVRSHALRPGLARMEHRRRLALRRRGGAEGHHVQPLARCHHAIAGASFPSWLGRLERSVGAAHIPFSSWLYLRDEAFWPSRYFLLGREDSPA